MPDVADPIRIFVGLDRSQLLGFRVLERSIRHRTASMVEVSPMMDLPLPQPPDPRHQARTGFSFSRFAIPKLAGFSGRAIYLDADMLVLRDIADVWNMPFNGAKIICQEELPEDMRTSPTRPGVVRKKQCSVMLMDCGALAWDAAEIISGLGSRYTYEQLMHEFCILSEHEISYALPAQWNSLEHLDAETCLIHYTDMPTQPWVDASNPNGWVWIDEVRTMLEEGSLLRDELVAEIDRRFVRPSLLAQLERAAGPAPEVAISQFVEIDRKAGFRPHAALTRRLNARSGSLIKQLVAKLGSSLTVRH